MNMIGMKLKEIERNYIYYIQQQKNDLMAIFGITWFDFEFVFDFVFDFVKN